MNELLESLAPRPPESIKVDRSEFLSMLASMETHYMNLYDEAMEGLRSVANMRRTLFQSEADGLIVTCKVDEDGTARIMTKVKEPIGFKK